MLKRLIIVIVIIAMLLIVIGGCQSPDVTSTPLSPNGETGGKTITLSLWAFQTFSAEMDQRVVDQIEKFSSETGVNVVTQIVPETTFNSKFTASLEANALPDILQIRTDTVMLTAPNYPFLEISEIRKSIEKDTGRSWIDSMFMVVDDKSYILPFTSSSQPAIYRTDVWTNGMPDTWDGVVEEARRVSRPDEGLYSLGIGCGPTDNDGETALRVWIWGEGGALFDEDGNPDPVQPGTIKVVQTYVDLYKEGVVPESATTWDAGGNNNSYLLEESSLHYNPFTVVNAMRKDDGYKDLLSNTSAAALPKGSKDYFTSAAGEPSGWAINKNCENVNEAQKLLTTLFEKEWYNSFVEASAPLVVPLFEDSSEIELFQTDEFCKVLVENTKGKVGWFGYPCNTVEGRKNGALVYSNYLLCKSITRIIQEEISVEEGLEILKQEMIDLIG